MTVIIIVLHTAGVLRTQILSITLYWYVISYYGQWILMPSDCNHELL